MSSVTAKRVLRACCPRTIRPVWQRIEDSEVGYRLAKGTFWSLAGTLVSGGAMLISSILIAHMMGKATYGEVGIVRGTVAMFGGLAGLSLGLTATKHVAEFRRTDPSRRTRHDPVEHRRLRFRGPWRNHLFRSRSLAGGPHSG